MKKAISKATSPQANLQPDEIQTELQEYTTVSQQRRKLLPRAALVGLLSGATAALFRLALAGADQVRSDIYVWAHQIPWIGWLIPVAFSVTAAVLSVAMVRSFAPEASGSGIPHLKAVLHRLRMMRWNRVLPVKFVAGTLALGGGLALGREGPTVQMGGAVGDGLASLLHSPPRERRTLITAGAGAGLAAAFNAPLSGLTFVLEEVQRDFHPTVFAAALIAAVTSNIVARLITGSAHVFVVPAYPTPPMSSLPFFALLGIAAGIFGVVFNRSLIGVLNLFSRMRKHALASAAVIGGLIGITGWFLPEGVGSGHALAESVLTGGIVLSALPLWFTLRLFLTVGSYGTGASGGIFAPLLVLGALLGLAVGQIAHGFAPEAVPLPAVFAVVGMAAYFTAIVRAPLTGILLIVEMTGNYEQMLPLLVSCFFSYATAELFKNLPIYEALLQRDLSLNSPHVHFKEPMVAEFEIEPGASFAGLEVRSLGLPPGCVLVRCVIDGRELVPTASTRLEAHMKITVFISDEAVEGFNMLLQGCKAVKPALESPE